MIAPRTEGSALLALILAVVVLLVYHGTEANRSMVPVGFAGALAGAGIALAAVRWKPGLFAGRRGRAARERCDEIRDLLVAELHAFEQEEERPVAPIRMGRKVEPTPEDFRKMA